ncbi:MAG: MFS transporter [Anaerolineales bacterium]|nr:MFS transporter [Anaerolineales bacterium]
MQRKPKIGILYAAIMVASSTLWGVVNGWLLYYYLPPTGTPLVPAGLFGLVMLVSRGINIAITLPIGYLSDRTRTRWGRRMPYIVGGAICLPFLFLLLWMPPHAGESIWNLVFLALALIGFNVAYEIFQTPYEALLPEIIPEEKQRVNTSAWASGFHLAGAILAGFAGPLIENMGYLRTAFVFALVSAPFLFIPLLFLREKNGGDRFLSKTSFRESVRSVFDSRPFRIFTITYALFWIASTFVLESLPYIVTEICQLREAATVYFFLPAVLVSLICYPLVSWAANRFGKERVFAASLLAGAIVMPGLMALGEQIPVPLILQGVFWISLQAAVLTGAQVLPTAIAAEITDLDKRRTGQHREGTFFAVWGLLDQLAAGVGSALLPLFLLLGRSAEDPRGPLGVRLLGVAGGLLLCVSFIVFQKYEQPAEEIHNPDQK